MRRSGAMKVKVISILEDNYMYLVIEEQSKQALAVDPAVPHRVRDWHFQFALSTLTFERAKMLNTRKWFAMCTQPLKPYNCVQNLCKILSRHYKRIINHFDLFQLLEIVKREGLSLTAVLTTHHHW